MDKKELFKLGSFVRRLSYMNHVAACKELGITLQTDVEFVLEELKTNYPELFSECLNAAKKKIELKEIVEKYECSQKEFENSIVR